MNKPSWPRQKSNSRKQERVIVGHSDNTPDTARHNSSDAVSGRLTSQLLCLFGKRCQPSLAFNFTDLIKGHETERTKPPPDNLQLHKDQQPTKWIYRI